MASDGQVTLGTTVMKQTAAKIRRLKGGEVLAGFAGSSADAFALFSRFESKIEAPRNLERAGSGSQGLAHGQNAAPARGPLVVADKTTSLLLSARAISPEGFSRRLGSLRWPPGLVSIADSASRSPARPSRRLQIDIYTNDHITLEEL